MKLMKCKTRELDALIRRLESSSKGAKILSENIEIAKIIHNGYGRG